jgi:hypothetical protein
MIVGKLAGLNLRASFKKNERFLGRKDDKRKFFHPRVEKKLVFGEVKNKAKGFVRGEKTLKYVC